MRKIIINADDCGFSECVNSHIEQAILSEKITSTTIMTNMDDFDGAVRLYNKYNSNISFGWHINLSEGEPLLYSQILLDTGYYIEEDNHVYFNGLSFWKKRLSKEMLKEIRRELVAQYDKLCDNGIRITHADSHHHIHTSPSLFFLMPGLFKDLNIKQIRRIRNYNSHGINKLLRNIWALPFKIRGIRMPDEFCSFKQYIENKSTGLASYDSTIELMCHPGFSDISHPFFLTFQDENNLLMDTDLETLDSKMITYREL